MVGQTCGRISHGEVPHGRRPERSNFVLQIIEAADIRRYGKDVFMQTGGYSNERGFSWLRRILRKEGLQLHKMTFAKGTSYYHLDAKFSAIDEGTVLYNADDLPSPEILAFFKENDWNLIEAPRRMVCVSDQVGAKEDGVVCRTTLVALVVHFMRSRWPSHVPHIKS